MRHSRTALVRVILLRLSPSLVPTSRALKKLWGSQGQKTTSLSLGMDGLCTVLMRVFEYRVIVAMDNNATINGM